MILPNYRFSMLFEPPGSAPGPGYEPPSKKACPGPGPDTSPSPGPLDCSKAETVGEQPAVADLRIRQVDTWVGSVSSNVTSMFISIHNIRQYAPFSL